MLSAFTRDRSVANALRFVAAFAVIAVYWPGVSGAGTSPRWALLAFIIAPTLFLAPRQRISILHLIGATLVAYALLTLAWSPDRIDAVDALLKLFILAAGFCLGALCETMTPVYRGAAAGVAISSAIVIAQAFGIFQFADLSPGDPTGLFVNRLLLAEVAALVGVALLASRLWLWLPLTLPALIVPLERGPILAFAVAGAVSLWRSSKIAALLLLLGGIGLIGAITLAPSLRQTSVDSFTPTETAMQRTVIWRETARALNIAGHGFGSYRELAPQPFPAAKLDHAHNEFLEVAFEAGFVGIALFVLFWSLTLWTWPSSVETAIIVALMVEACFAFPLHEPVTAALGLLCAGHRTRSLPRAVDALAVGRALLRRRLVPREGHLGLGRGLDQGRGSLSVRSSLSRSD
jgi:hypothetical protein